MGEDKMERMTRYTNLMTMSWNEIADLVNELDERIDNLVEECNEHVNEIRDLEKRLEERDRKIKVFSDIYEKDQETIHNLRLLFHIFASKDDEDDICDCCEDECEDECCDCYDELDEDDDCDCCGCCEDECCYYDRIAQHIWRKFEALCDAGFSEEQAMQLIPLWTDDDLTEE